MQLPSLRSTFIVGLCILLSLSLCAAFFLPWRDWADRFAMRKFIYADERALLFNINHDVLAANLRRFGNDVRWSKNQQELEPETFDPNDSRLPDALRIYKVSAITVYSDRIQYDCGSALFDYGLLIYREGIHGSGTKELIDGVWFYSSDGSIPSEGK